MTERLARWSAFLPVSAVVLAGCSSSTEPGVDTDCARHSLAVGESVAVLSETAARCVELADGGSRYVVTVLNTGRVPGQTVAFELRGTAVAADAPAVAALEPARHGSGHGGEWTAAGSGGEEHTIVDPSPWRFDAVDREARRAHLRMLERNRQLMMRLARTTAKTPGDDAAGARVALEPPAVGSTREFRIPEIDGDLCNDYDPITARVVYSGPRVVVYEDEAAELAGQMDDLFREVAEEFEASGWDVVLNYFGDPFAYSDNIEPADRVLMVFSERVNELGPFAFVFSGDLFAQEQCESSDKAALLYARVPTSASGAFGVNQRGGWHWRVRTALVHETKHIVSFAARLAAGPSVGYEEVWLEEATARIAEELWARTVFGYGQRGSTIYNASLYKELRPGDGWPMAMWNHFADLYDYYEAVATLTPISTLELDPAGTFYGSGWSLVRWALDHSTQSELAILRGLVQGPQSGLSNLESRVGKDFAAMLADWSLATALDNRSGFQPQRPELGLPSWNTRDVFAGMNAELRNQFPKVFPLTVTERPLGDFTAQVPALRGGTFAVFELSGSPPGEQRLELFSATGQAPPGSLRLAIARLE